jgi:hypothetical protein
MTHDRLVRKHRECGAFCIEIPIIYSGCLISLDVILYIVIKMSGNYIILNEVEYGRS